MHYRVRCEQCGATITECPCDADRKAERMVVCVTCLTKAAEAAQALAGEGAGG